MSTTPLYVTDDVKSALIRATPIEYKESVACLCMDNETGVASLRVVYDADKQDFGQNITQIIDVSETESYGSYIDLVIEPDDRVHIPGHPEILALFEDDGDEWETLMDELSSLISLTEYIDPADPDVDDDLQGNWDTWAQAVIDGGYAHTLDDCAYSVWEYIVADIEDFTDYIVVEA